jgi:hypothetical protein
MNDFKEPNKTMQNILDKHRFDFFGSRRFDMNKRNNINNKRFDLENNNVENNLNNKRDNNNPRKNIALYALKKIEKYHCNTYPAYLFIILDDADFSELKSKNNSPFIQLLKVCRYLHISCAICVQTVPDSIKELKRLIGDVVLYRYLTYNDLEQTIEAIPTSDDIDEILPLYKGLTGKHGQIILHALDDSIDVRDE